MNVSLGEAIMDQGSSAIAPETNAFWPTIPTGIGLVAALMTTALPQSFAYMLLYPVFRLVFGTLYPAYASYKAVRTKDVKEYVSWSMWL